MDNDFFTRLLGAFFDNTKVVSFRLIAQGAENTTALVQTDADKVIVRIWGETHGYMGAHSENDIIDEVTLMDFCRANSIPVPRLFHAKSGSLYEKTPEGRSYTVMEYVEGKSPQDFTNDMTTQIARVMARMHLLVADFQFPEPRSWPGTVLDMTDERIKKFESGDFAVADRDTVLLDEAISTYRTLLSASDLANLPRGAIHGDIMWENMKFDDGQLRAIFDFGDCRESYFVEDIAKTLLFAFEFPTRSVFGQDGKNVRTFLDAYQAIRQLSAVELHSLRLFFISRFLYQVLGYYAKVSKGELDYQTRIDQIITRYQQHKAFFNQESYE